MSHAVTHKPCPVAAAQRTAEDRLDIVQNVPGNCNGAAQGLGCILTAMVQAHMQVLGQLVNRVRSLNCRWPPSFRGIINTLEVAHQDFVWRVRSHPRILQVKQNACACDVQHCLTSAWPAATEFEMSSLRLFLVAFAMPALAS